MTIIAYQYGLLDPIDWDRDCHEHLYRMNRLWNSLVEIERGHRAKVREIIGADDAVRITQTRLDVLRTEQAALREQRKARRKAARARVLTPDLDDRLRAIASEIQPLAAQCKIERKDAIGRIRGQLRDLDSQRFGAVKSARQPDQSGLWWGNYNAVIASYETARSKAMRDGAELRFRRFTGEGRFTVQIIGGADIDMIMNGAKQVGIDTRLQSVPGRSGKTCPRLWMTIYTRDRESRKLTWPIIYDRPLPENCRVQQVVVTRRRVGTQWRYAAIFTCRLPVAPSVSNSNAKVCGINLGFRAMETGLRVATIWSDGGVERPAPLSIGELRDHVATIWSDGGVERWHLSPEWIAAMDDVEAIRQRRDKALTEIHTVLRSVWSDRPDDMPEDLTRLADLVRAPQFAPGSLAVIAMRWRELAWWPDMRERVELWRRLDRRKYDIEATKREHLALTRREHYRLLARSIAQRYDVIRIGKIDLRRMEQVETAAGKENELHQRARRNRYRASLYLLQQEIAAQAVKFGSRVEKVDGPVTITCHACGARCSVSLDVMHVCEHCSCVWDQDENAARNIFAAPRERSNGDESVSSARAQ